MTGITRDEWVAALKQAEPVNDPDVFTTYEIGAMVGIRGTAARKHIRRLFAEGKVARASKRITDTSGRVQCVTAYRLVRPEPSRKKK